MDAREQRGMELAATRKIQNKGKGVWIVPSQAGPGAYTVNTSGDEPTCSCPDHENRGSKCKHIFAAYYVMKRERNPDGSTTVTESLTVETRKTYPQNWPAYNAAQVAEKDRFQVLLRDLCSGIPASYAETW